MVFNLLGIMTLLSTHGATSEIVRETEGDQSSFSINEWRRTELIVSGHIRNVIYVYLQEKLRLQTIQ